MVRNARFLLTVAALACAVSTALQAQEAGTMTHDELIAFLGVHANVEDYLQEIDIEVNSRGAGAPKPVRLAVGHVAEKRFVIKLQFAETYPRENTVLHIYADIDDDEATGRKGSTAYNGTDIMYSFVNARNDPRFFNRDVRVHRHYPVRAVVAGDTVYVCDDLNVARRNGATHFRLRLLSHLRDAPGVTQSTSWFYVNIPLVSDRGLPRLPIPEPAGFSSLTMPNFAELSHSVWTAEDTVRLRPADARVSGFQAMMNDDFAGLGRAEESVHWRSPVAGPYHVGLVTRGNSVRLQRSRRLHAVWEKEAAGARLEAGVPGLDVIIDGRRIGTIVGDDHEGEVIHYSRTPVGLNRNSTIEVRSAEHSAAVLFHSVYLSPTVPAVPSLRIENLAAWHLPDMPGELPGRMMVAWTTNRPTTAVIDYRTDSGERSGQFEGRGLVNNHYLMLPPEIPGEIWELDIVCTEAEQNDVQAQQVHTHYTVHRDRAAHLRAHGKTPAKSAEALRIELTVAEPTSAGRTGWPLRSGVPLPEGVLSDPAAVRLLDASGSEVPVQTQATSWWPGGLSVRWLLLDFAATTTAGEPTRYTLEVNAEPAVQPRTPVQVRAQGPEGAGPHPVAVVTAPVEVHTGPLIWRLDPGGFAPFADVKVHGRQTEKPAAGDGGFELGDAQGGRFTSALEDPEQIIVEHSGPRRATLRVNGRFVNRNGQAFMRYLCRMHFYAGSAAVRTVFTLENDVLNPDMNTLRSLSLTVPLNMTDTQIHVGADGKALELGAQGRLLQDEDSRFTLGEHQGRRADGWLLARSPQGPLAVAVRDFWQRYPKGFRSDGRGVVLDLLPSLPDDIYADADDDARTQWYFWAQEGHYKIRTGLRLSTDFSVDYAPQFESGNAARYEAAAWWREPLFAACSPEHYRGAGVLDTILPRDPRRFERYEQELDKAFRRFEAQRETRREYGFMNYGDWFGERTWNWGNNEYDTAWALAANFLRSGNRAMLQQAVLAAEHSADVDTIHQHAAAERVGYQYTHCTGHTAGYFPRDWKNMGGFNVHAGNRGGHIWSQGLFAVYALTGEERLLETGRKINDMLAHYTTDFRYGAERAVGWPMVAVMAGYDFDANPYYLNAATLMTDIVIWTQHPERGLWGHWIDANECDHAPRCWGSKPFMTGVLLRALKMVDRARPREDLRQTLHNNVAYLFREAFVREGERPGFVYSSCRNPRFSRTGSVSRLSLIGPGLAYSVLIDPQQRQKDLLAHAAWLYFTRASVSSFGKGFTQASCFLPTTMHDLAALGFSDYPGEPLYGRMELQVPDASLRADAWTDGVVRLRAPRDRALRGMLTLDAPEMLAVDPPTMNLDAEPGELAERTFRVRPRPLKGLAAYAGPVTLAGRFRGNDDHIEAQVQLGLYSAPLQDLPLTQAADFIEQDGGKVQVRDRKVGHVGTSISHWDDPGHRLTWRLQAPRDGDYVLVLRYCAGTEVRRKVQIGNMPDNLQRFPGTGGFSTTVDNWRHRTLLDDQGDPVILSLTAGSCRITMTNLCGNGMNLDYLALLPLDAVP